MYLPCQLLIFFSTNINENMSKSFHHRPILECSLKNGRPIICNRYNYTLLSHFESSKGIWDQFPLWQEEIWL